MIVFTRACLEEISMNNFTFNIPTDIRFGKGQIESLSQELEKYGKRVLLVYGGGSIKKNGIYDQVMEQLEGFKIWELSGITPNPKVSAVRKGAALCKEHDVDVILAVGGGSTIDATKHIAAAACYEGDAWDLILDRSKVKEALPFAVVLTICATGSEMNCGAVITNEETNEKLELNTPLLYPRLSICDPTYLFTLPKKQTAAGAVDILSHVMEQYFQPNDEAYITDVMSEAVMKTVVKYGPIAMEDTDNYEARSNLMWASTIALNHLLTSGKGGAWSVHPIEHVVSGLYDITHGIGLAILTPAWMEYVLSEDTKKRFARFAREVFDVTDEDDMLAAKAGITAIRNFFQKLEMPGKLSEAGIDDSNLRWMAKEAVRTSGILTRAYVKLDEDDVEEILRKCL